MKRSKRVSLNRRLILAFVLLISIFIANTVITLTVLYRNKAKSESVSKVIDPALKALDDLRLMVIYSQMLTTNWVYLKSNTADRESLIAIHKRDYPDFKRNLLKLSIDWKAGTDSVHFDKVVEHYDNIIAEQRKVLRLLPYASIARSESTFNESSQLLQNRIIPESTQILLQIQQIKKQVERRKSIAQSEFAKSAQFVSIIQAILFLVIILLSTGIALYLSKTITRPIANIADLISGLRKKPVDLSVINAYTKQDEIGDVHLALKEFITLVNETTAFANKLGNGDFSAGFEPLSEHDQLGIAMVNMRHNLELFATESNQRNLISKGIADVADLIRKGVENPEQYFVSAVQLLSKFAQAKKGILYELVTLVGEKKLQAVAGYAINISGMDAISLREGLAGQCAADAKLIHIKDVPDDFVLIESGLGDHTAKELLFVPLNHLDTTYGVLELATLTTFDSFQLAFLKNACENIAVSLHTIRLNASQKKLLIEAQSARENLMLKEEQLRQNLEELQASQEELIRRNNDALVFMKAVKAAGLVEFSFNSEGWIENTSDRFNEWVVRPDQTPSGMLNIKSLLCKTEACQPPLERIMQLRKNEIMDSIFYLCTERGEKVKLKGSIHLYKDFIRRTEAIRFIGYQAL